MFNKGVTNLLRHSLPCMNSTLKMSSLVYKKGRKGLKRCSCIPCSENGSSTMSVHRGCCLRYGGTGYGTILKY